MGVYLFRENGFTCRLVTFSGDGISYGSELKVDGFALLLVTFAVEQFDVASRALFNSSN